MGPGCRTMPGLILPECVGSSWMTFTGPHVPQIMYCIMHWCVPHHQVATQTVQELTDALIQVWEEIPQDTICLLIQHAQTLSGVHTGTLGPYTLLSCISCISCRDEIHANWISLRLQFFTLIFGDFESSPFNGLMILVSIDCSYIILFSKFQCISMKIFNLNILFIKIHFKCSLNFSEQCRTCFFPHNTLGLVIRFQVLCVPC